ncbi:MAG: YihA family ribosome biogenesis GTP-binding protein [Bacteroidetes bacterium]|nr:MAG: YihA family ribosome biogenesis GTP-binding protein [Bacteroidota bacterium]
MYVSEAKFVGSFPSEERCPAPRLPEYAFIGRSNVGKSSLINMLTGRKDLAKVSQKPGKTQMLNFFLVEEAWYLVDLPGYGYARISKKARLSWQRMIWSYLEQRPTLQCAFVLIDANVPPQESDILFINRLGELQIPFVLAYTKTDRLKKHQLEQNVARFREELLRYWSALPREFITSATTKAGREEVLNFIREVNATFQPVPRKK